MRLKVAGLRGAVKGDSAIEFSGDRLTSYAGLELVRRYIERIGLRGRLRAVLADCGVGGDYDGSSLVILVITLLMVGARRLRQPAYIGSDPLVRRTAALARIPSATTVRNWLRQFTQPKVEQLARRSSALVFEHLQRLDVRRITLDVDGTVVRTGDQVEWAFRGFNPHHRKDKSYYPLLAHVAQTGQILRLKNRPGNVHDSKGAIEFMREVLRLVRAQFGPRVVVESRMDAAFFQRPMLQLLARERCEYAIKVPFWKWVGLKPLVAACKSWTRMSEELSYFETTVRLAAWHMDLPVVIYRKRVAHETRKNFQLDLFSPDDGHFEYSAITSNKTLGGPALWAFMAGRGAQEKTIAELKGEFALDVVPTRDYAANSAWQQICILAHNLLKSFQLDTTAQPKVRSPKRTAAFLLQNMRTVRFELITRAARLCRPAGRTVLRVPANPATQTRYEAVMRALAA
jgi:hypothetical protein